jgi:SAM-dependent methyltransferase
MQPKCAACNAYETVDYCSSTDRLLGYEVPARVYRCGRCDSLFQWPALSPSDLAKHYPDTYHPFRPSDHKSSSLTRWKRGRGDAYRVKTATDARRTPGRLLDIGCATGEFLRDMKVRRWDGVGVEPHVPSARRAGQIANCKIYAKPIEDVQFDAAQFDLITMWDVLEHLQNPNEILAEAARWLRPTGTLILRIPNPRAWEARAFGRNWAGLDQPRHIVLFSESAIREVLNSVGLVVCRKHASTGQFPLLAHSIRYHMESSTYSWLRPVSELLTGNVAQATLLPYTFLTGISGNSSVVTYVASRE